MLCMQCVSANTTEISAPYAEIGTNDTFCVIMGNRKYANTTRENSLRYRCRIDKEETKKMNNFNTPAEIVEGNINGAVAKAKLPFWKLVILGIMAGMFIGGGAAASNVAMHSIDNVGIARLIGGCIFPVGLMMIVFIGGELFTGDCMMVMAAMHKKIKWLDVVRVLVIVWVMNLIGGLIMSLLIYYSGQLNYTGGLLGAFTIKVAMGKNNISFGSGVASGILCNIFVCAAVLMGAAAKDIAGKVWGIFFPIMAFVVVGYEHCVANMYYIPAGIIAAGNEKYAQLAMDTYGYTAEQMASLNWTNFFVQNEIPVTIGNIIGGAIFVGVLIYVINRKNIKE